jgi:hypothetical protein
MTHERKRERKTLLQLFFAPTGQPLSWGRMKEDIFIIIQLIQLVGS